MNSLGDPRRGLYRLVVLALVGAGAWAGLKFYRSAWLPYEEEQPIKRKLGQSGVRFLTEGVPGRVVDAFSPHSVISESCLADLAQFKRLKRLELVEKLSDDGIASLRKMRKLEFLHIYSATDEQLKTLRASLPDCHMICEITPSEAVKPAANPDGPAESN